jgi:protein-S-isoprenylcysteine O-methyltransferase Ste14
VKSSLNGIISPALSQLNDMVIIGNFLFRHRNYLFPIFYLILFAPSPAIFDDFYIPVIIGLSFALFGQAIRILTIGLVYIIRGGKHRRIYAKELVTDGIFAHCRNPLYLGNILILTGLVITSNSLVSLLILLPLFVFAYQAIVMAEEDFLQDRFGPQYKDYLRSVNRWVPHLKGIGNTIKSSTFKWKRVIVKEYNSTYIWLTGAVLLILKNYYSYSTVQDFHKSLLPFLLVIFSLTVCYSIVRYFKKSHKLVGD